MKESASTERRGAATVSVFVPGIPKPGGSKRAFINQKTGRAIVTEDCKGSKDWRTAVRFAAAEVFASPLFGPLEVAFRFYMPRPRGHYGSGRNAGLVRESAPKFPAFRPDVTKLVRSTEDALKGVAWLDDSQIVRQAASKDYSEKLGAQIEVTALRGERPTLLGGT